jgi:hypothetical protein
MGILERMDAIEIKAKKLTPNTQKNESLNEIRVDGKVDQDDDNKVFVKLEVEPSFPVAKENGGDILKKILMQVFL